jgi:hypothetical protein
MPDYYVTFEGPRGGVRQIGPIFAPSANDAELMAKLRRKGKEEIIDICGARVAEDSQTVLNRFYEKESMRAWPHRPVSD